jgi:asparagine synthase (glutamine-hydrolysing)
MAAQLEKMTATLRHRGPDDSGGVVDAAAGVALGARRLAIIDLSHEGHQPMVSQNDRYVVVYNGEIYNFLELRVALEAEGARFRGSSDTEVLVAALQRWGLRDALVRCNGMFALAVWDRQERRLHLARDRFGEKPLYYGWAGQALVFGSELKALRAHGACTPRIDRDALALYFRLNCIPAPHTIYRNVRKVMPGSVVSFDETTAPGALPEPDPFWSLAAVVEEAERDRMSGPEGEVLDELDRALRAAVHMRMHADVALGAFLSGGIDSSLVVALMQAQHTSKVKTFTISFEDAGFDEATDARAVADHLGTEHHELVVTAADALATIPTLADIYDEPFSDSSQIPTAVLAPLTRRYVTVALSGDGGDELFGGYNRYVWSERFWRRIEPIPRPLRRWAGAALSAVPPVWVDHAAARTGSLLHRSPPRLAGIKLQKVAQVLPAADLHEVHVRLASHATDPARLVLGADEPTTSLASAVMCAAPVERMMYLDTTTYLPDDILTKVDRATMAASLEGRMPYLDPALAALAWRLPLSMKVRGRTGKWALRRLLHRYVPSELVERPKAGFGVPLGTWLRGPLRPWAEELLDAGRLERQEILDPTVVRDLWREHLSGRRDRQYELWDVLMFQAWADRWLGSEAAHNRD